MAELNTSEGQGKKGSNKVRSKKLSSTVDLTAMVDLAFLLITFFMLTTSLSKPQSMDLSLPDRDEDPEKNKEMKIDENRTVTMLLGEDDKLMYYVGRLDEPLAPPTQIAFGRDGIRQELLKRKKSVVEYTGDPSKGLIVIIKPSKESTYKNLVDALDEMAIVDVPTYAITDITPEEVNLLEGTANAE